MARLNLDFSNVESRTPLPEGVYDLEVSKVEMTTAKSSGNPMMKVEFRVLTDGFEKRKLFSNYVLTADAMWKVQELMLSLGMDADSIVDIDTDELIGLTCKGKVAQREYEGEIYSELKKTM